MAKVFLDDAVLIDIANNIREKTGTTDKIAVSDFKDMISESIGIGHISITDMIVLLVQNRQKQNKQRLRLKLKLNQLKLKKLLQIHRKQY